MKTISKLALLFAIVAVSTASETTQAQVRDAGAKARGDYSFLPGGTTSPLTMQRATRAPVAAPPLATAQSRSYSYNSNSGMPVELNRAATPSKRPSDAPSVSRRPANRGRTYSYTPAAPVMGRSAIGVPFGYSGGVRNAASKVLGQY